MVDNFEADHIVLALKTIRIKVHTKLLCTSSRLKRTPPIGAPKATETPAAAAADSTYEQTEIM